MYDFFLLWFLAPDPKFDICDKFYSKDARLPVQLQRAMAAEAEAAREARAKVNLFCFIIVGNQRLFKQIIF